LYSGVIARVFEFSKGIPAEFRGIEYRIVLRFLPSFDEQEWQVIFIGMGDRKVRVIRHMLEPGVRPISEQCNELLKENPKATIEDALRRIKVHRYEETADGAAARLVAEFFELSIPTKLDQHPCLDGTRYGLWVDTISNRIQASLSDCAFGEDTEAPLMRWIRSVQGRFRPPR
jgi:hypothetical protein